MDLEAWRRRLLEAQSVEEGEAIYQEVWSRRYEMSPEQASRAIEILEEVSKAHLEHAESLARFSRLSPEQKRAVVARWRIQ